MGFRVRKQDGTLRGFQAAEGLMCAGKAGLGWDEETYPRILGQYMRFQGY